MKMPRRGIGVNLDAEEGEIIEDNVLLGLSCDTISSNSLTHSDSSVSKRHRTLCNEPHGHCQCRKSKRKKSRWANDSKSHCHKSDKVGDRNNTVLNHTRNRNVVSERRKAHDRNSDVTYLRDDRHGHINARRGSAQEKENAGSHRCSKSSEKEQDLSRQCRYKSSKHCSGRDSSSSRKQDKPQKHKERHNHFHGNCISPERSKESHALSKKFHEKLSFENFLRYKDNTLMRKLLGSGTIQRKRKSSDISDLNCEVGSVLSISSPELDNIELEDIAVTVPPTILHNNVNTVANASTNVCVNSSDSEIEVIIPEKKIPELIELQSDSETEQNELSAENEPISLISHSSSNHNKSDQTLVNSDGHTNEGANVESHLADHCNVNTTSTNQQNDEIVRSSNHQEDDADVLQLRLDALRSAVMKKYLGRVSVLKKKQTISTANNVNDDINEIDITDEHQNSTGEHSNSPVNAYCPSDRTSPLSPTISSVCSVRDEDNVEELDMAIASSDEDEMCIDQNLPSYQQNLNNVDESGYVINLDINYHLHETSSEVLNAETFPSETVFTNTDSVDCCNINEIPPQPLPPGVELSNLPPEFSHSVSLAQDVGCNNNGLSELLLQSPPPPPLLNYVLSPTTLETGQNICSESNKQLITEVNTSPDEESEFCKLPMPLLDNEITSELINTDSNHHAESVTDKFKEMNEKDNVDCREYIELSNENVNSDLQILKKETEAAGTVLNPTVDESMHSKQVIFESKHLCNDLVKSNNGNVECKSQMLEPCNNIEASRNCEAPGCATQLENIIVDNDESTGPNDDNICFPQNTDNSTHSSTDNNKSVTDDQVLPTEHSDKTDCSQNESVQTGGHITPSGKLAVSRKEIDDEEDEDVLRAELLNSLGAIRMKSSVPDTTPVLKPIESNKTLNPVNSKSPEIDKASTCATNNATIVSSLGECDISLQVPLNVIKNKYSQEKLLQNNNQRPLKNQVTKRKVISVNVNPLLGNKKFIIKVGEDSDSGEEISPNKIGYKKSDRKSSIKNPLIRHEGHQDRLPGPELEKRVDLLLKEAREKHETRIVERNLTSKKNLQSSTLLNTKVATEEAKPSYEKQDSSTPLAVKHLPKYQQEEYRRLKQQIVEKEKLKQQKLLALNQQTLPKKQTRVVVKSLRKSIENNTTKSVSPILQKRTASDIGVQTTSDDSHSESFCSRCNSSDNISLSQKQIESRESLNSAEKDLINERFKVLESVGEMDELFNRMKLLKEKYDSANKETSRLKELLKLSELNAETCANEFENLKKDVGLTQQKLLESKVKCSHYSKNCQTFGSEVVGPEYELPKCVEDLVKNRSEELVKKKRTFFKNSMIKKNGKKDSPDKHRTCMFFEDTTPSVKNSKISSSVSVGLKRQLDDKINLNEDIESVKRVKECSNTNERNTDDAAVTSTFFKPAEHVLMDYISPLYHLSGSSSRRMSSCKQSSDHDAILCPYDLKGNCMDDKCPYLHGR